MASSRQCSACSANFSWFVVESAQQLFPLLCGEVLCRNCLGQLARETLSRRISPLRCCQKVVPHDFVRMVLAYEEDVYYSYLLNQPKVEAKDGKLPAASNYAASFSLPPLPPITVPPIAVPPPVSDDTEMKQPARLVEDKVTPAGATGAPIPGYQAEESRASTFTQVPLPRYVTRGLKARFAEAQNSTITGSSVNITSLGKPSVTSQQCHLCGTKTFISQFKAPCGHTLCQTCMEMGVRRFLDAPSNNNGDPVSCCGQLLPLYLVQQVISRTEATRYAKLMFKHIDTTKNTNVAGTKRKADSDAAAPARKTAKGKAPASSSAKQRAITKKGEQANDQNQVSERKCAACFLRVSGRAKWLVGPCGHGYCRPCIAKMAISSLSNRAEVPIRCCSKELPMEYAKLVLNKQQYGQYERFFAERDPLSSTLKSDQEYKNVVRRVKGKQCPECGIGVVKVSGCDYMRCSLGHNFCWNCLQAHCNCRSNGHH